MAPSSPIKGISYTRTFDADSQPPLARRASLLQYKRAASSDFIPGNRYVPESSHPDANPLQLHIPPLSFKASAAVQEPYNGARDHSFEAPKYKPSLARHSSFASTFGVRQRNSQRQLSHTSSFSIEGNTPLSQFSISTPLESRQPYNTASVWARKANHDLQSAAQACLSLSEPESIRNKDVSLEATKLAHVLSTVDTLNTTIPPTPVERIAIRRGSQIFYHTAASATCPTGRPIHPLEAENIPSTSSASSVAPSSFTPSVPSSNRGSISTNSTSPTTTSTTRTNSSFNDSVNSREPCESRSSEDERRVLFRRLGREKVSYGSSRDTPQAMRGRMSLDTAAPLVVIDGMWNPTPSTNWRGRMGIDEIRTMTNQRDEDLPSDLVGELFEARHQDEEVDIGPHSNMLAMKMTQSIKKPIDKDIVKERWWKRMFRG